MQYKADTCTVELSVRLLCRIAFRQGDLGVYRVRDSEREADRDAYKKIQANADGFYRAEVTLGNTTLYDGIHFAVEGKADGIIRHSDGTIEADVIRCLNGRAFFCSPQEEWLAQLKCYAYFLTRRDDLPEIRGRLTYYHTEQKKIRYFRYCFVREELQEFYFSLLEKIKERAKRLIERQTEGLSSAASALFPYPQLRDGQEQMIRESLFAIRHQKRLFAEVPTGTGKTVSALYAAVRALGAGYADKIFYLTAKAAIRREAYAAAGNLFAHGVKLRTVVITAKEQVCLCGAKMSDHSGRNFCNPMDCEYAKGYYDRVDAAIRELLTTQNGYPRSLLCETAKKYRICPYEFSLDLSEFCDIIICDYNYAFDPSVYFRRYFSSEERQERYVFLIDEAHNLAERARDMYSAEVRYSDFETVYAAMGEADGKFAHSLEAVMMTFRRQKKLCRDDLIKDAEGHDRGFYVSRTPLTALDRELELFCRICESWCKKHQGHSAFAQVERLHAGIRRYLSVNEFFDTGFLTYVQVLGGDITVKTYCLDPSSTMDALLNRADSAILFSATLTPSEYFCDVLGNSKKTIGITLPSPFPAEHCCVAVADYLSVRSEDRAKNFGRYATVIAASVSPMPGNYIAYFPSYACLKGTLAAFCKKYPKVEVVVQKEGMNTREKEEFLSAFRGDEGHLRVGFCVLGGAFAEGVDLPGSRLIGTVIFGVGLPGISNERNMIRDYFDQTTGQGYDYAYTYPGMNRVLQAAGRVIRREQDRGIVVLVDDRYAENAHRVLFPKHWQNVQYAGNASSLAEIARRFWENRE